MGFKDFLKSFGKTAGKVALDSAVTGGLAAAQVNPLTSIIATILTTQLNHKDLPLDAIAKATLAAFQVELSPEEMQVFVGVVEKISHAKIPA